MSKAYLQSKTIWGVLVALAGWGLNKAGIPVVDAAPLVDDFVQLGGLALAVYGRARAIAPLAGLLAR